MLTRISRILCVAAFVLAFSPTVWAQSIKLLAPNVGWMVPARNRVAWTVDGGFHWKNITPPAPKDSIISAIFFLDAEWGWVLLARGGIDIPGNLQFDLARTNNSGATWLVEPLKLPNWTSGSLFNGGASLSFADRDHGWLALDAGLTPISQGRGAVFATADGGRTWTSPHKPHTAGSAGAGPIVMVTPRFGWLVGGPVSDELYVSRDGAQSWEKVELDSPVKTARMREYDQNLVQFQKSFLRAIPPAAAGAARQEPQHRTYATYNLPTFKDPKHGHICVDYPGVTVLFETEDGGITWKSDRIISGKPTGASAVVDSTWVTATLPKAGVPHLRELTPGAPAATSEAPNRDESVPMRMSFLTPNQGWVMTIDRRLLSTSDGGATWTDITPR